MNAFKVRIRDNAFDDLQNTVDYYRSINSTLGKYFLASSKMHLKYQR